MFELKIGNTFVDTAGIEIPVVLRSPLFADGKGSYMFNFTLPASDELKKEFSHFHRPGGNTAPYLRRELSLKMGPLHYTGTATITTAGPRAYEVSCPIENGDLAAILKETKLTELDLGGVRDSEDAEILISAVSTEDIIVDDITPAPPAVLTYPIYFDDISINKDGMLNVDGDQIEIFESGKIVLIVRLEHFWTRGLTLFRIYKGPTTVFSYELKQGSNFIPIELDVISGDIYDLRIAGMREPTGPGYVKTIFTIYAGAELKVFGQGEFGTTIGTDFYPEGDFAIFPIENPQMFDSLDDDSFMIDHLSIKEVYSKYFPVMNYYVDNKFPLIMTGETEDEGFSAFNVFIPFPYLAYVIKRIAQTFGITISNNVFEDNDLRQLVIFNLYAENSFLTSELIQPRPGFDLADHVPDVQISTYFKNLCKLLGIAYDFKSVGKTLRLKYLKDIAADQAYQPFPGTIINEPELTTAPYQGYRLKQEVSGDDYISTYFKSLKGLNYKGTVTIVNQLSSITNPEINDCYYVTTRREYWIWNYDTELGILNWISHSKDFFSEMESIDENIPGDVFEVISDINAIMLNGWDYMDNNICRPSGRHWLIPVTYQPGTFDGLPDYFRTEFTNSLLFFHGLRADSQLNLYPLGTHDRYDYAGNPIVYESVIPGEGYTHDLSLRWDGPHGLYEKRYKGWIEMMLRSRGFWKFKAALTPWELSKIDMFTWYQGNGFKFLIKELRFSILKDKLTVAELEVFVK